MGLINSIEELDHGRKLQCTCEGALCESHRSGVFVVEFHFGSDHGRPGILYGDDDSIRASGDSRRIRLHGSLCHQLGSRVFS